MSSVHPPLRSLPYTYPIFPTFRQEHSDREDKKNRGGGPGKKSPLPDSRRRAMPSGENYRLLPTRRQGQLVMFIEITR